MPSKVFHLHPLSFTDTFEWSFASQESLCIVSVPVLQDFHHSLEFSPLPLAWPVSQISANDILWLQEPVFVSQDQAFQFHPKLLELQDTDDHHQVHLDKNSILVPSLFKYFYNPFKINLSCLADKLPLLDIDSLNVSCDDTEAMKVVYGPFEHWILPAPEMIQKPESVSDSLLSEPSTDSFEFDPDLYRRASPLSQFLILKGIPIEPKPAEPQQIETLQVPPTRSYDYHPTRHYTCIASHLLTQERVWTRQLESLQVTVLERSFPFPTLFINSTSCVIVCKVQECTDQDFMEMILDHVLQVNKIHLLLIADPFRSIRRYSYTKPVQKILFALDRLSMDMNDWNTQLQAILCTDWQDAALWTRKCCDMHDPDLLPSHSLDQFTTLSDRFHQMVSFLSFVPVLNPFMREMLVGSGLNTHTDT
ncbi:hypothetical protein EDD86DRAFT_266844 [Gorgonomyces haynaldii]|nr:hypothetical protein EDD86DRAFT_266844 [Gorgonomyces haynaldii]